MCVPHVCPIVLVKEIAKKEEQKHHCKPFRQFSGKLRSRPQNGFFEHYVCDKRTDPGMSTGVELQIYHGDRRFGLYGSNFFGFHPNLSSLPFYPPSRTFIPRRRNPKCPSSSWETTHENSTCATLNTDLALFGQVTTGLIIVSAILDS